MRQDQAPGIPAWGTGSKKVAHAPGTGPYPIVGGPTNKPSYTHVEGLGQSHAGISAVSLESVYSHKLRSVVSMGSPAMILTPPCS